MSATTEAFRKRAYQLGGTLAFFFFPVAMFLFVARAHYALEQLTTQVNDHCWRKGPPSHWWNIVRDLCIDARLNTMADAVAERDRILSERATALNLLRNDYSRRLTVFKSVYLWSRTTHYHAQYICQRNVEHRHQLLPAADE